MEAIFLLGVGFTRDTTTAIVCLTLAVGFSGFAISGKSLFYISHFFTLFLAVVVFIFSKSCVHISELQNSAVSNESYFSTKTY